MHRNAIIMLFTLLTITFSPLHFIVTGQTKAYTKIYISPSVKLTSPGETFSIDIAIFNVTDLAGYTIAVLYNSTILNGTSITEGPFLKQGGSTYFYVANFTDTFNLTGTIYGLAYFTSILYVTPPGVSGSGVLASISFKAKISGDAILQLWSKYTSLTNSSVEDILYETGDGTVHVTAPDVAITSITLSQNTVLQGEVVHINVTAKNEGGRTETFNVATYRNNALIGTQTVSSLAVGANTTLTFNWNTAGVSPGDYLIKANATAVPGEIDIADNTRVDGTVKVIKRPVASFTCSPPYPAINQTVTFDASTSTPNGGTITTYMWDFGDLNTTSTPNPIITHKYAMNGTYTVTLTITDSESLTDSTWKLINVTIPTNHDVAIINVKASANEAYQGWMINVNVTAENQGEYAETFNVTAYCNETIIGTQTVTALAPDTSTTLTFIWNTTTVTPCQNYTIKAEASIVSGETDTADNKLTDGTVKIKIPGDANGDKKVDWQDLLIFARAYGSFQGEPAYVPEADFNSDGKIDWKDLLALARNYGKTCP